MHKNAIFYVLLLFAAISFGQSQSARMQSWTEQAQLHAPQLHPGDGFGNSVGVFRHIAIIGAPADNASGAGAAYIFRYDPERQQWLLQSKLIASDAQPFDRFGHAVAITANLALVGAWNHDYETGAAYLFRYDPNGQCWHQEAKLTPSPGVRDAYFGYSVCLRGDTAIIGAPRENSHGTAYIFRYDQYDRCWLEQNKLVATDAEQGDLFGAAVGLYDDTAVVGAYGADDVGYDAGAAYIFRCDSQTGNWLQQAKITAADAQPVDSFGYSVGIYGKTVVVGAHGNDIAGNGSGTAYVFHYDDQQQSWQQQTQLIATDAQQRSWFGNAVSIDEEAIIIGAYGEGEKGQGAGASYIFQNTPQGWQQRAKITATDTQARDRFGSAVAIHEQTLLIGARCIATYQPGVAYIFMKD